MSRFYEWFIFTFLKYDYYLCVSNYTKNCMRIMYGIPDYKLQTVYNGIDYQFRDSSTLDDQIIKKLKNEYNLNESFVGLYFWRLGLAKGIDVVLESIQWIVKKIPNYKQVFLVPKQQPSKIFGLKNSFDANQIQEYIKQHKLEEHVVWIESCPREELKQWIGVSDVVLLPTRAEGFGFAISEVCALGKPLITTNVASVPEVVYGTVKFVEPGSSEDVVKAVQTMKDGQFNSIPPKKFERSDCIQKVETIYQRLIDKKVSQKS